MSSSPHYAGANISEALGENKRWFYALRRTDEGTLYLTRVDQLTSTEAVIINDQGLPENDFEEFEYGVDFFDGRDANDHSRPYLNLHFDQYRWDNQTVYYYINANGEFVVRVNGPAYAYS
jgi:hypothetical protein